jgi:hypothetical protein
VATLWLLIGVALFHRQWLRTLKLRRWAWFLLLAILVGKAVTVLLNQDPITQGAYYLHGHNPYDAVTAVMEALLAYAVPFVVAAALFRDARDVVILFRMLVGATLVYALFQLVEVRLSPQFNNWVYGFFQHSWEQMVRGDGFRPIVFMAHGLTVAMFTLMGILAAATLQKRKLRIFRARVVWVTSFLWVVLLLNKSVAAFLYSVIALPLILFFKTKTQFRVAMALAVIVFTYPVLRGADVIPVQGIAELMADQFGEDRARSLMVRFTNEKQLLERALERPFFGWGAFGRIGIYDVESGKELSIPDGEWILTLGNSGIVGFLSKYLLLLLPIFVAARKARYIPRQSDRRLIATLALMVGFSAFDMLPNSDTYSLPFLFSGALLSCSTGMARQAARQRRQQQALRRQQAEAERLRPGAQSAPA